MNKLDNIEFEILNTIFGIEVLYADFLTVELENLLKFVKLKELPDLDSDGYKALLAVENGFFILLHSYKGGMVYKSLKDYKLYEKHFNRIEKKEQQTIRAFTSKDGKVRIHKVVEVDDLMLKKLKTTNQKEFVPSTSDDSIFYFNHSLEEVYNFKNIEDFRLFIESLDKSVFFGCNPYGEGVLNEKANVVIKQLHLKLGIPIDALDYTPESLNIIDKHIYDSGFNDIVFYEIFLGLTLYLGECIIKSYPHEYKWFIVDEYIETKVPVIIKLKNYYQIPLHIYLYESLKSEYYIGPNIYLTYDLITNNVFNKEN